MQKNGSIPNFCHGLKGTFIGIAGSFSCDLATAWHGIQFSTLFLISSFIPGQYKLCIALKCILTYLDDPYCNDSIHDFLRLGGIINLPRYAMQPSSMLISSLRLQYLLRAGSISLQWLGHPWINYWISSCNVVSFFCSSCIIDTCISVMHGVNSCMVKSSPFNSILS